MNAVRPSFESSDANASASSRRSYSTPRESGAWYGAVAPPPSRGGSPTGPLAAMSLATRLASSSHDSFATTRATSPASSASACRQEPAAEDHVHRDRLADGAARAAACRPAPGMIPSPVSGWPNRAVSDATIRSQAIASSQPPPRRNPETAATSGVPELANRVPALDPPLVVEVDRRRLGELSDIRAGREGALRPGEHDAANAVVAIQLLEALDELPASSRRRARPAAWAC